MVDSAHDPQLHNGKEGQNSLLFPTDSRVSQWVNNTRTQSLPPNSAPLVTWKEGKYASWTQARRARLSSISHPIRRCRNTRPRTISKAKAAVRHTKQVVAKAPTQDIGDTESISPAIGLLASSLLIAALLPSLVIILAFVAILTFAVVDGKETGTLLDDSDLAEQPKWGHIEQSMTALSEVGGSDRDKPYGSQKNRRN